MLYKRLLQHVGTKMCKSNTRNLWYNVRENVKYVKTMHRLSNEKNWLICLFSSINCFIEMCVCKPHYYNEGGQGHRGK